MVWGSRTSFRAGRPGRLHGDRVSSGAPSRHRAPLRHFRRASKLACAHRSVVAFNSSIDRSLWTPGGNRRWPVRAPRRQSAAIAACNSGSPGVPQRGWFISSTDRQAADRHQGSVQRRIAYRVHTKSDRTSPDRA